MGLPLGHQAPLTPCSTAPAAAAALPEEREAGSTVPPEPCTAGCRAIQRAPGRQGVCAINQHAAGKLVTESGSVTGAG